MELEFYILDLIQTMRTPAADKIMVFFTSLGNGGIIWILLSVICMIFPRTRKTGIMTAVSLCLVLLVCNGILKNLVARARPFEIRNSVQLLIARPADFSFPSGHTAAGAASAAALYSAGEKKLWKPAAVLAGIIAFSRLYLYVHYPTDVLGGALAGILLGYTGCLIIKKSARQNSIE